MEELKPKTFRVSDSAASKIREIAAEIGGSHQETFVKLIEAYEFQSGKEILKEKKADIEQFERYVTVLTRMFMSSLEDNQNVTETVRAEFDASLKSKESTIQDLQLQLNLAKQLKSDAEENAKTLTDENMDLKKNLGNLQDELEAKMASFHSMLSDKEKLNQAMGESLAELKEKMASMQKEHEDFLLLHEEFDKLQEQLKDLKNAKESAETTINSLKQQEKESIERCREQLQIAQDKALLESDRKYQNQIQKLKEEKQNEIDKYQKKYFDLLEVLQAENFSL